MTGKALYRTLLKACGKLATNAASAGHPFPSSGIQNLIRHRFHQNRNLRSPNQIRNVFSRGQSAIILLHDANGGAAPALKEIAQVLQKALRDADKGAEGRAKWRARQEPQRSTPQAAHVLRVSDPANHRPAPDSPGLSAHPIPLADLKSPSRIVPKLIGTSHKVPFLRYGKQPVYLSRVIRQKTLWLFQKYDRIADLDVQIDLGHTEDDWDRLISSQASAESAEKTTSGAPSLPGTDPPWGRAAVESRTNIYLAIRAKAIKTQALGQRMWDIVKQEQRLKNWEDLPINVARAIRTTRKLEIKIYKFAQLVRPDYHFPLRPHNIPITDEIEMKQIGRFHIPVEWAKRAEETKPRYWRDLEDRVRNIAEVGDLVQLPNKQQDGKFFRSSGRKPGMVSNSNSQRKFAMTPSSRTKRADSAGGGSTWRPFSERIFD